jgi:adenosine deaminase
MAKKHGMEIAFIATVVRHLEMKLQEPVIRLAMEKAFQGLDLAGDELHYPADPFIKIFREAQEKGLGLTIHAGEIPEGVADVRQAILDFGARRIGHGIFVLQDPNILELAREKQVTFEVCPTSNAQTGTWREGPHPIKEMMEESLKVTLNTDNPQISQTNLKKEVEQAKQWLSETQMAQLQSNAAEAAFRE